MQHVGVCIRLCYSAAEGAPVSFLGRNLPLAWVLLPGRNEWFKQQAARLGSRPRFRLTSARSWQNSASFKSEPWLGPHKLAQSEKAVGSGRRPCAWDKDSVAAHSPRPRHWQQHVDQHMAVWKRPGPDLAALQRTALLSHAKRQAEGCDPGGSQPSTCLCVQPTRKLRGGAGLHLLRNLRSLCLLWLGCSGHEAFECII